MMEFMGRFNLAVTRLVPAGYREHMRMMLIYAGDRRTVERYFGSATFISIILFAALNISFALLFRTGKSIATDIVPLALPMLPLVFAIVSVAAVYFLFYIFVYLSVTDRTTRVEESLPDALHLMSANIRAGMTPFQAMKLAARREFGPLKEEIETATTRALGTESFAESLLAMSKRVQSGFLERTMQLFTTAMKSGGQLAQLLEDMANDIAETRALKKELVTNTKMYSMLIIFTVIVGAPILLSISVYFVRTIGAMQASAGVAESEFGVGILPSGTALSPWFFIQISIVMLTMTSILASMLIGVILEGNEKFGLKYAPLIVTAAIVAFIVADYAIELFFGLL